MVAHIILLYLIGETQWKQIRSRNSSIARAPAPHHARRTRRAFWGPPIVRQGSMSDNVYYVKFAHGILRQDFPLLSPRAAVPADGALRLCFLLQDKSLRSSPSISCCRQADSAGRRSPPEQLGMRPRREARLRDGLEE
jgi:hypothetical protein